MSRVRTLAVLSILSVVVAGCSGAGSGVTDPDSLVRFTIPSGWAVRSEANGTRLGRIEPAGERTVLMVTARPLDEGQSPASVRELRISQIAAQNGELTIDRMSDRAGVTAWESLHESPPNSTRPWMHTIHLFPSSLHVQIALLASPDKHADYVADLESVAESVKPL